MRGLVCPWNVCLHGGTVSFSVAGIKQHGQLSIYNRILVFRSGFPDIPRKISAYLRADFPSGANTRKIRGFHKMLNISNLCLMGISSLCEKHHFGLRNGLYWSAKWCFSASEMGNIALQNGQYRNAGHIFSDYVTGYIIRPSGPKEPSSRPI